MPISIKHHYLPEFYLKGFINERGKFSIYNYQKKKIEHKEFVPSMYFYDNRNFIEVNGVKHDTPELMYSQVDQRHSALIKKIQLEDDIPNLNTDEMLLLQEFVSSIFWRLPSNDEYFLKQYRENRNFTKNFVLSKDATDEIDIELTKNTINNPAFIKTIKPFIPLILKPQTKKNTDLDNWQFVYDPLGKFTCSDEPIVFRKEKPVDIFDSEFIFPLSKNHLLLRTFNKIEREEIPAPVIAVIQLLLFVQGKFYCCSGDKNLLKLLLMESSNLKITQRELFAILDDKEWLNSLHEQWLYNKANKKAKPASTDN